tara:strand:- start:1057 stop:2223 length:1167 start_codon:yes stop_codon:yes gene_type:complete
LPKKKKAKKKAVAKKRQQGRSRNNGKKRGGVKRTTPREREGEYISNTTKVMAVMFIALVLAVAIWFIIMMVIQPSDEPEAQQETRKVQQEVAGQGKLQSAYAGHGAFDFKSTPTETQALINRIETGYLAFGESIQPLIASVSDERIRTNLQFPFDLVRVNEQNPNRNYRILQEEALTSADQDLYRQKDINYFSYILMSDSTAQNGSLVAAFSPLLRAMTIADDWQADNLVDILVLSHEIHHVGQDTNERVRLDTKEKFDAFQSFYGATDPSVKPVVILNYELAAYAYEIELMNLLLNGYIRLSVDQREPINIDLVASELKAREDQRGLVELLCNFAQLYYPEALSNNGAFNKRFARVLAGHYMQLGYRVYICQTSFLDARLVTDPNRI